MEELLAILEALFHCCGHLLALARKRWVAKRDAADQDVKDISWVVLRPSVELAVQRERFIVCDVGTSVLIGLAGLVAQVDAIPKRRAGRASDSRRVQAKALGEDPGQVVPLCTVQQQRFVEMRVQVTAAIHDLFPFFMSQPDQLPKQWRKDVASAQGETALARIVCDYISGMTDRFALQEWKRLKRR